MIYDILDAVLLIGATIIGVLLFTVFISKYAAKETKKFNLFWILGSFLLWLPFLIAYLEYFHGLGNNIGKFIFNILFSNVIILGIFLVLSLYCFGRIIAFFIDNLATFGKNSSYFNKSKK